MDKKYSRFYSDVSSNEENYRKGLANILNMQGPSEAISMATAGNPNVDIGSVPSVSSLANMRAGYGSSSKLRQSQAKSSIRDLPNYARSYNQYLKWRYPTRYGGGSGSTANYGRTGYTGTLVEPLTGIASLDLSGDGWPG